MVDGVASTVTLSVPADSAVGVFSDTTNSVAVPAGAKVAIRLVNAASDTSANVLHYSAQFEITHPADFAS
jgi:hypothetical protein